MKYEESLSGDTRCVKSSKNPPHFAAGRERVSIYVCVIAPQNAGEGWAGVEPASLATDDHFALPLSYQPYDSGMKRIDPGHNDKKPISIYVQMEKFTTKGYMKKCASTASLRVFYASYFRQADARGLPNRHPMQAVLPYH